MFGSKIDIGFLVYTLPYMEDLQLIKNIGSALTELADKNMSELTLLKESKKLSGIDQFINDQEDADTIGMQLLKLTVSNLYDDIIKDFINPLRVSVDSGCEDFKSFLEHKLNFSGANKEQILAEYIGNFLLMTIGRDRKTNTVKMDALALYIENYISAILSSGALNWEEMQKFLMHSLHYIPEQILSDTRYREKYYYLKGLGEFSRTYKDFTTRDDSISIEAKYQNTLCDKLKKLNEKFTATQKKFEEKKVAISKEHKYKTYTAKMLCEFVPLLVMLTAFCIIRKKPEPMYIASAAILIANNTGISTALKWIYSINHSYKNKYAILVTLFTLVKTAYRIEPIEDYRLVFGIPALMLACSYLYTSYFDWKENSLCDEITKKEEKAIFLFWKLLRKRRWRKRHGCPKRVVS